MIRKPYRAHASVSRPQPDPKPVFSTFAEWEEKAESRFDAEGPRGGWQRSVYDMQGYEVFLETTFPWNVFKKTTISMPVVSMNIPPSHPTMKLAAEFGAEWEQGYYSEEGFGWPIFSGDDCAERCWNFIVELKRRKEEQAKAI